MSTNPSNFFGTPQTRGQAIQRKPPRSGLQRHFCKNYCTRVFISVMPDPWRNRFVNHTAPAPSTLGTWPPADYKNDKYSAIVGFVNLD